MNAIFDQPKREGEENVNNLWMEFIFKYKFEFWIWWTGWYILYTFMLYTGLVISEKKAFLMKHAF